MKTLRIDLGPRSYRVCVGENILDRADRLLGPLGFTSAPVVITNATVLRLHGVALLRSLRRRWPDPVVVKIGDGERYKDLSTLTRIYEALIRARADRRSWIIAFGGGVVGDIAGFAAATFMRGVSYVGIPTTLLAQVDSSVGGKVGINVPQGKNLVGAFHQPAAVLSDTATLRTLPRRELAAGLFEVIKCGAIRSESLLGFLERRLGDVMAARSQSLERVVYEATRIKADVVSRDEREGGLRMILNFGHTVGHALEAATDYRRFKHGEAVAWGMIAAAAFGRELGLMNRPQVDRLSALIRRVSPLPDLRYIAPRDVWSALQRDKKFRQGAIRLVLLRKLGDPEIRPDVDARHLRRFLSRFLLRHEEYLSGCIGRISD